MDSPPSGKILDDSKHSLKAGRASEEAWACPDKTTHFSFLKLRKPLRPRMCKKAPWRSTGQEAPPGNRWRSCVWPQCWSPAQLEDAVEDAEMNRMWIQDQTGCVTGQRKLGRNARQQQCKPPRGSAFRVCHVPIHKGCALFYFFLPDIYAPYLFIYFPPWWEFFSAKMKGQSPCHWPLV